MLFGRRWRHTAKITSRFRKNRTRVINMHSISSSSSNRRLLRLSLSTSDGKSATSMKKKLLTESLIADHALTLFCQKPGAQTLISFSLLSLRGATIKITILYYWLPDHGFMQLIFCSRTPSIFYPLNVNKDIYEHTCDWFGQLHVEG